MKYRLSVVAAGLCLALHAGAVGAAADSLVSFTSRGAFAWNDSLDWGPLGFCNLGVNEPFEAQSAQGVNVTGSLSGGNAGAVVQSQCWGGNFLPDENLLWTQRAEADAPGYGPITLLFDRPIYGFGTQFQSESFGTFTARIDVFNGDTFLQSFTNTNGLSNDFGDGSAIFLGVIDLDGPNITRAILSVLDTPSGTDNNFAINQLSLETPPPVPVPEPTSLVLLGTGGVMLALRARRIVRRIKSPLRET